jgi:hypothetical protein
MLRFSMPEHKCSTTQKSEILKVSIFQYGFYGIEEYENRLKEAGLNIIRVELIPKDMIHPGKEQLMAWIRTMWLPYAQNTN